MGNLLDAFVGFFRTNDDRELEGNLEKFNPNPERAEVEIKERFEVVDALFDPRRTDDLKPGVADLIGWRGEWRADWIIEEGEPFAGEWAMVPQEEEWTKLGVVWVPSGDLLPVDHNWAFLSALRSRFVGIQQ